MKKVLLILLALLLCSCSAKTMNSFENTAKDGISLDTIVTKEKNKAGNTVYHLKNIYTNNSDAKITEIQYQLIFCDKNNEELFTFSNKWNGQDIVLNKGEVFMEELSFQEEINADKVKTIVTGYKDSNELSPIKIPQVGDYLYQAIDNEYLNNIGNEYPEKAEIIIDHMGAQAIRTIEGEEMADFIKAFMKVKIAGPNGVFVTDNYNGIRFTFADGNEVYLPFILYSFEFRANGQEYLFELSDAEEMWSYAIEDF